MKISAIPPALFLAFAASSASAAGVPTSCATIQHNESRKGDGIVQKNVTVSLPSGPSLRVTSMQVAGAKNAQSASEFGDAASVLFLTAMSSHRAAACTDWLKSQGEAMKAEIQAGQNLSFEWSGMRITNGKLTVQAKDAAFSIRQNSGDQARANLALSGITVAGSKVPDLLPEDARAVFSLPQTELSSLMAATGGRSASTPVAHVKIESFEARRGSSALSGSGSAQLTGSNDSASAEGHLEVAGLNTLISAAQTDGQTKLAAGMVVAKLVSHKKDGRNTWDASWSNGILTVNGVPVPLR